MGRKSAARKQARLDHYPRGWLVTFYDCREDVIEIMAAIENTKDAKLEQIQTWKVPNLPGPNEICAFFTESGVKEVFAQHMRLFKTREEAAFAKRLRDAGAAAEGA